MTHPVHTVIGHVVEIGEVLIHWRRERESGRGRWGKGWMGRRGEQAEEETMSERKRRGGRWTHTYQRVSQMQW